MFLGLYVCPENGVHAGKVPLSVRLEPLHHIAVETKMNRSLSTGHDNTGALPEVRAERLCFGSIRTGLVLTSFPHSSDLFQGVSHDGRFLFHLCSLSGR